MKRVTNLSGWPLPILAVLVALSAGCAAPNFVPDGPFGRSLKDFRRVEIRPVRVTLESKNATKEQAERAREFAAEFGGALVHRLHHRGYLDAAEGPTLVLESRVLKCEWTEIAGNDTSPSHSDALLRVAVTFRDESGTRIGGGTVTATGAGAMPRFALENARNGAVASLYKFIRKGIGRKGMNEAEEPAEPELVPSP
jgi:hypothetical protein